MVFVLGIFSSVFVVQRVFGVGGAVAAHAIVLVFMPPEPLPWDRKDFFRERKHERSESLGSVTRWRDSSHHGSRELNRWATTDFRRPPGAFSILPFVLFFPVLGFRFSVRLCFLFLVFRRLWVINFSSISLVYFKDLGSKLDCFFIYLIFFCI